jgi:hypothetical protein
MFIRSVLFFGAVAGACVAQEFELGGAAGYGFNISRSVSRDGSTADAGFRRGLSFSAFGGHDMHRLLGGELRYTRRDNDLFVSSGGTRATLSGEAHMVHYDALVHAASARSRIRPFLAFGGGIKIFKGTGTEREFQPLEQFAVLTRTSELTPMVSVGGGVKFRVTRHAILRFDVRDYMTPFPSQVVLPAPGTSIGGWLHDVTPMIGISAHF